MKARTVGLSLALIVLAGCSRTPARFQGSADVVYAVAENAAAMESLAGMANFRIRTPDESMRLGGTILFQRPDRMRVEILSPTGQAMATLVVDSTAVTVHDHREALWYTGDRSAGSLAGLPVEVEPLLEALRDGGMPASQDVLASARVGEDGSIRLQDGPREILLELDEEGRYVRSRRVRVAGIVVEDARYEDVRTRKGILHPDRIRVDWPLEGRSVDLRFRKKVLNGPVTDSVFDLPVPEGATVISLATAGHDD